MGFRFLEFRVYKDAKDFYLFCMPYIKKLKDENLKIRWYRLSRQPQGPY